MIFDEAKLTEQSKENLNYWLSKWETIVKPSDKLIELMQKIHSTHTFGHEERWEDGHRFPYKEILLEGQGILSQRYREQQDMFQLNEPRQNLGEGHILSSYVFAYLGVHDHFYSQMKVAGKRRLAVPAYGVFLPKKLDDVVFTNASRRDLSSPQSDSHKLIEFFTPADARMYTAYEIMNSHQGDFNHYWGDLDNCKNNIEYSKKHWEWKTEFHYFEKIETHDLEAILWPLKKVYARGSQPSFDPDTIQEVEIFRQKFPTIQVYNYHWDLESSFHRFTWASYIVTEYFSKNQALPSIEYFAEKFNNEFKM